MMVVSSGLSPISLSLIQRRSFCMFINSIFSRAEKSTNNFLSLILSAQQPSLQKKSSKSGGGTISPTSLTKAEEMCSCFRSNLVLHNESEKTDPLKEEALSVSVSTQLKDVVVRIVHAGGRIERFENAIPASKLILRNPGMCIARPDVFRNPSESVLSADDMLLPGNKYYVVRSTTVEKLIRRRTRSGGSNGSGDGGEAVSEDDRSRESVCGSGEFVVSKGGWSVLRKNMKGKKQFVPPIQRPRVWKEPEWEPSLTSIREVSL